MSPQGPQRLRNWTHGLWPDGNVLRRASDRLEAGIVASLLVAFLIGAPLVGLLGWQWAAGTGRQTVNAQHSQYQVTAVLLANAPYQGYAFAQTLAQARWTAHDGSRHTGEVSAPMGAKKGTTVRIWTDGSGKVTEPPLGPGQVTGQAALAAVIASVALTVVLVLVGALAHLWLQRRRMAAWDADWRATGPQWTHQR